MDVLSRVGDTDARRSKKFLLISSLGLDAQIGLGADDCVDPLLLLLLTAPGMSRGPSAFQVSLARWLPPNILLHFFKAQIHFIGLFLEIPGIWSKDV